MMRGLLVGVLAGLLVPSGVEPELGSDPLARIEQALGVLREAVEDLKTAQRLEERRRELAAAHVSLAVGLLSLHDDRGARNAFAEALRLDPTRRLDPAIYAPAVLRLLEDVRMEVALRPARLRSEGHGSLAVTAEPWASLQIDDGPPQQTPLFLMRVEPGPHRVVAARPGFESQTHSVVVQAGETTRLHLRLVRR